MPLLDELSCNASLEASCLHCDESFPVSRVKLFDALRPLTGAALEKLQAQRLGLVGDALVAHRRRYIRPLATQLERWCDAVAPTLLPSEPLMATVRYYQRHKDALFRFIDDADVPIDNSATEREFQNVAKLRLNVLFAGSTEGRTGPAWCLELSPRAAPSASRYRPTSPGPSSGSAPTGTSSTYPSRP